jgi:O-antigen/teichoic acid export membrane protein
MLAYGINTFLYTMGALILFKASDIIIAMYIGTEEVSQFAVAIAGIILLSQFLRAFTAAIKPAVSDLDARDEHWRVREISFLMQKYSLLLIIPAGCFLVVMGREFLQIWVGEEFRNPAVVKSMSVILAILTVGHCLRLAQHSNFIVLVGKGEHRLFGLFALVMALLCVLGSVVSVKVFNLGLLGVAWSNCLPVALISGVVLPIYFNRKMNISMRESILRIWWPALLGGIPAVIMISSWKYFYPPDSWLSISLVVLSAMLLTCLSAWCLSFTRLERSRLARTLIGSMFEKGVVGIP